MLQPTLIPADLARWAEARPADLVMVPVFADVRPLRGAAGLLDWRLGGKLSGWMIEGRLTGAEGEQLLFPSGGRVAWRLVLAAGAGRRAELGDQRLRAMLRRTMKTLRGLNLTRVAVALPARDTEPASAPAAAAAAPAAAGPPSARRALDLALAEIEAQPGAVTELSFLVPAAAQKELAEALRRRGSGRA